MESETLADEKPMICEFCKTAFADVESFSAHSCNHPKENAISSFSESQSTSAIDNNLPPATSHSQECIISSLGDGNRKPYKCRNCSLGFDMQFELHSHSLICPVNASIVEDGGISEEGTSAELRLEEDPVIPLVAPVEVLIQEEPLPQQQIQVNEMLVDPLTLTTKVVRKPCPVCNALMVQHHLDAHFLKYHSEQQFDKPLYECRKCKWVFGSLKDLKDHSVWTRHNIKPYKCNTCSRKTHSMLTLTIHKKKAHQLEDMKCEKCGNIFENEKFFKWHCKKAEQVEMKHSFTCVICGEGFVTEERLFSHQGYHWDRKRNFLTDIIKINPNRCEAPKKVSVPKIAKTYTCPYCPKTFMKTTSVWQHCRRSHKTNIKNSKSHKKGSTSTADPINQLNNNADETEPQGVNFEDQFGSSSNNISYDNIKYEYVDIKCEIVE